MLVYVILDLISCHQLHLGFVVYYTCKEYSLLRTVTAYELVFIFSMRCYVGFERIYDMERVLYKYMVLLVLLLLLL